jgi:hypothetical protein
MPGNEMWHENPATDRAVPERQAMWRQVFRRVEWKTACRIR